MCVEGVVLGFSTGLFYKKQGPSHKTILWMHVQNLINISTNFAPTEAYWGQTKSFYLDLNMLSTAPMQRFNINYEKIYF